jgi:putative NADH-flavin reductase
MTGPKILVLGATGPSGICLLRELLYRNHQTVAYVRNPTKIPADLAANPLLEVCRTLLLRQTMEVSEDL